MMNKTNLWIDLGIFAAFLLIMDPGLTGITLHEWLSVAFAAAAVAHLLLHWDWLTDYALPLSMVGAMAMAIPITNWVTGVVA